ncbi:MAG: zinc-binding alcohol dehydrogenase [Deltaproteobacteria bacterium]|nr:zinc-binding alcohol dehydrogenase [Deltaproteobacteria bacterium]
MTRRSLYFVKQRTAEVREENLTGPRAGEVLVQTLLSGISAGTELLVYRGEVPAEMAADETIAALSGTFAYPLKYGYAAVGRVTALGSGVERSWDGSLVFAFQPHESHFSAAPQNLLKVPPGLEPEDAVFLANMETAVTLALDGAPLLGEKVAVFGQGVVGLLLTALLAKFPLGALATLDLHANRRLLSETLGAQASFDPADPQALAGLRAFFKQLEDYDGADLTYEVSGSPAALDMAVAATGYHGRVVIGSWYGKKRLELNLGGEFHRRRQRLISSQVSTIAPELRGRFTKARCLDLAWRMIKEINPRRLISHRFPLAGAPQAYAMLDRRPEEALQVILTYE